MLTKLYQWYGRKTVWGVFGAIILLLVVGLIIKLNSSESVSDSETAPTVKVAPIASLTGESSVSLLGTVKAVSEADLQTQKAGQVTSVQVSLGQAVSAGAVIATLENASEQAAVLQAEGVYDAAVAAAAQSDIGVTEAVNNVNAAKNTAINAIRSAYTTNAGVVIGTLDEFYTNPNNYTPGVRLSSGSYTEFLNTERRAYETLFEQWLVIQNQLNTNSGDLETELAAAQAATNRTINLVDIFLELIVTRDQDRYSEAELNTFETNLVAARSSLNGVLSTLNSATTNLTSAEEALTRAELGGTTVEQSAANAQIKQALGSLRAAQANLAKTIIRTPIAGTVNQLNVSIGDFVGSFASVARIANNNALEITTFVGENDLKLIAIGDTVQIDGVYSGTITHIGAGVDSQTQKTEVKIGTETDQLTNGDTVEISIAGKTKEQTENQSLVVPISAIKFSAENGVVYTVVEGVLVPVDVVVGQLRGAYVEITSGVTPDMEIVVDARGLTEGSKVEAVK